MASRVLTLINGTVSLVDNGGLMGDYNSETLNGTTKNLSPSDATFQYFTVTANTILNFPLASTADQKIFYIINLGNKNLNLYENGVDLNFRIKKGEVFLAHSAIDWFFIQLT